MRFVHVLTHICLFPRVVLPIAKLNLAFPGWKTSCLSFFCHITCLVTSAIYTMITYIVPSEFNLKITFQRGETLHKISIYIYINATIIYMAYSRHLITMATFLYHHCNAAIIVSAVYSWMSNGANYPHAYLKAYFNVSSYCLMLLTWVSDLNSAPIIIKIGWYLISWKFKKLELHED